MRSSVNWIFVTDLNFLIPLSLQPGGVKYYNFRLFDLQKSKFEISTTFGCKGLENSSLWLNSFGLMNIRTFEICKNHNLMKHFLFCMA